MKRRIVMLGSQIDDEVANVVVAQLLFLESESETAGIELYVNSTGGAATASLAIIDTLRYVKPKVSTVCVGRAAGAAALVLACGERGSRLARPNATVQLLPFEGEATSLEQHRALDRLTERLVQLFVEATQKPHLQLVADLERGRAFTAEEALAYGLVDAIV